MAVILHLLRQAISPHFTSTAVNDWSPLHLLLMSWVTKEERHSTAGVCVIPVLQDFNNIIQRGNQSHHFAKAADLERFP